MSGFEICSSCVALLFADLSFSNLRVTVNAKEARPLGVEHAGSWCNIDSKHEYGDVWERLGRHVPSILRGKPTPGLDSWDCRRMGIGQRVEVVVGCGLLLACSSTDETMRLTRFTPGYVSVDELPLLATISGEGLGNQVSLSLESDDRATRTPVEASLGGMPLQVVARVSDTAVQVLVPAVFAPGVYDAELTLGHHKAVLPRALTLSSDSDGSGGAETAGSWASSESPACSGAGCGRCTLGDWSEPELVAELESEGDLWSPSLSSDGLTLYFAESLDGVETIFEAKRRDRESVFEGAQQVTGAVGEESNGTPAVSADGLTLYFHSSVVGGDRNLWRATRASTDTAFEGATALTTLNSSQEDHVPWVSADGSTLLFASQRPGLGSSDLWVATRTDTRFDFGNLRLLGGVNGPTWDSRPVLTEDGRWLYFCSARVGGKGQLDIWTARRVAGDYQFQEVTNMSTLNSRADEMDVTVSRDDRELLFVSNRSAPENRPGQARLWRATRECL